jgi:hypothetical protein
VGINSAQADTMAIRWKRAARDEAFPDPLVGLGPDGIAESRVKSRKTSCRKSRCGSAPRGRH